MRRVRRPGVTLLAAVAIVTTIGGCADSEVGSEATHGGDLPGTVVLRPVDGSYPVGLPDSPTFFPLGVWLPTVGDPEEVTIDRGFGLNLYVGLAHHDDVQFDAIEERGMHVFLQADEWFGDPRAGDPAIDGWVVHDEADLTYGPGWDDWTGEPGWNTCAPAQDDGGRCGYTVMQHHAERVPAGALRYTNFGLGVLHLETDAEAEVFVNHGFQDVVSADDYAFTRPDVPAADRAGVSYGRTVERLRELDALDGRRQPVWAVVETGHPFSEDSAPTITAPQLRSAVWHSLIAGARGIVYFDHSFGGVCVTSSTLRSRCDPEVTHMVTALNSQISELAPVLNAPFADGYVVADGPVEVMAKRGPEGDWYIFAAAATDNGGDVAFRVAVGSTVEVVGEGRDVTMRGGRFVDSFNDGDAVHIYRVT